MGVPNLQVRGLQSCFRMTPQAVCIKQHLVSTYPILEGHPKNGRCIRNLCWEPTHIPKVRVPGSAVPPSSLSWQKLPGPKGQAKFVEKLGLRHNCGGSLRRFLLRITEFSTWKISRNFLLNNIQMVDLPLLILVYQSVIY